MTNKREWFKADDVLARKQKGWKEVSCEKLNIPKLADMALMEKMEKEDGTAPK